MMVQGAVGAGMLGVLGVQLFEGCRHVGSAGWGRCRARGCRGAGVAEVLGYLKGAGCDQCRRTGGAGVCRGVQEHWGPAARVGSRV